MQKLEITAVIPAYSVKVSSTVVVVVVVVRQEWSAALCWMRKEQLPYFLTPCVFL